MPPKSKPEDLGIKIGTPDEALWTAVKEEAESLIKQSKDNIKIQEALLGCAITRIAAEQAESSMTAGPD